jgi:hypothetical protein
VVCADLGVFHEVLGDIPVYLNPSDRVSWTKEVRTLARVDGRVSGTGIQDGYVPPSWQDHFDIVLTLT